VFNQSEVKEFIVKYGKKWLFPDFANKLTWFVVSLGGAILLTPVVFKQLLYNWLVDSINLNSGNYFTIAELQSDSTDYAIGASLILLGLLHNIANRYFIYRTTVTEQPEKKELEEVDKQLFKKFLAVFPSDSLSIELLRDHDFGNSYHKNGTTQIDEFVDTWNTAEKEFLDQTLENKRKELWTKCRAFVYDLATASHFIGTGPILTCIPNAYIGTDDWPEHVDIKLRNLNVLSSECYELHRNFVLLSRHKLKC
jgi:hypothetical protein